MENAGKMDENSEKCGKTEAEAFLPSEEALSAEELIRYHHDKRGGGGQEESSHSFDGVFSRKTLNWTGAPWEKDEIERRLENWSKPLDQPRVEARNSLNVGEWRPDLGKVVLSRWSGKLFEFMGLAQSNSMHLWPEEALYLLECSQLDLKHGGIPMSIQRAYFSLISGSLGLDNYLVYSKLMKFGYRVVRHQGDLGITAYQREIGLDQYETRKKRKLKTMTGTQIMEQQQERSNTVQEYNNLKEHNKVTDISSGSSPVKKEEERSTVISEDEERSKVNSMDIDLSSPVKEQEQSTVISEEKERSKGIRLEADMSSPVKKEHERSQVISEEKDRSIVPSEEDRFKQDTQSEVKEFDDDAENKNIFEERTEMDLLDDKAVIKNGETSSKSEDVSNSKHDDKSDCDKFLSSNKPCDKNTSSVEKSDKLCDKVEDDKDSQNSKHNHGSEETEKITTGHDKGDINVVTVSSDEDEKIDGTTVVDLSSDEDNDVDEIVEVPRVVEPVNNEHEIDIARIIEYSVSSVNVNEIRNIDKLLKSGGLPSVFINPGQFLCRVCNVTCNSEATYAAHLAGAKHKKLERQNGAVKSTGGPVKKSSGVSAQMMYCEPCGVQCESLITFKTHVAGKKHIKTLKKLATGEMTVPARRPDPEPSSPSVNQNNQEKGQMAGHSSAEGSIGQKTKREILNEIPNCFGLPFIKIKAPEANFIPEQCRPSQQLYTVTVTTGQKAGHSNLDFEAIIAGGEKGDGGGFMCRVCQISVKDEKQLISHIKTRQHVMRMRWSRKEKGEEGSKKIHDTEMDDDMTSSMERRRPCRGFYPKFEKEVSLSTQEETYNFGYHVPCGKKGRRRKRKRKFSDAENGGPLRVVEMEQKRSRFQFIDLALDDETVNYEDVTKTGKENEEENDVVEIIEEVDRTEIGNSERSLNLESSNQRCVSRSKNSERNSEINRNKRGRSFERSEIGHRNSRSRSYERNSRRRHRNSRSGSHRDSRSRSSDRNSKSSSSSRSRSRSRSRSGERASRSKSRSSFNSSFDDDSSDFDDVEAHPELRLLKNSMLGSLWSYEGHVGPLICPEMAESMRAVFQRIQVGPDPWRRFKKSRSEDLEIVYDCYKSSSNFRKSIKMAPDYRVVIVDPQKPVPDNSQLMRLENRFADKVPILFAVVDRGTVSFVTMSSFNLPTFYEDET